MAIAILLCAPILRAQDQSAGTTPSHAGPPGKGIDYLFNYLNMAGTTKASDFKPMTQHERNRLYLKTMVNPLGYAKAGLSAGLDQWEDKPEEWEQGASGYGRRFGNIIGQYSIQRTVTFGLSSALHEDNRYFNSGKSGVWPRTGYALSSGILARRDDGTRHISISQLGGVAAGAFLARLWQPPSTDSAGDGAVSFGISMASNIGFSAAKEFLPDIGRAIAKKRQKPSAAQSPGHD
ncbi:hypothetical protein [Edaphobacter bradus]|uniref:hypothetical protein n=1 Tax=Edaphobacter bradus TaxID=2259016 RepID=UPI0021DF8394|nr:hypothetical protein [Edaphobacter bradus]